MFYLGIDIGKNTHVASLIDSRKKVLFKAFSFSNSIDGAESLICKLEPFKNQIEIGMEATGHYWLSLYSYLSEKNFTVRVINPIQTDGWRQGIEIRKRKTDIIDSLLIADLLMIFQILLQDSFSSLRSFLPEHSLIPIFPDFQVSGMEPCLLYVYMYLLQSPSV